MESYDAFISYSHHKDKRIAQALQSVVQDIGRPWWRRRALRIFRDDSSLAATATLWPSIASALDRSRYLVLLASPDAAASIWVGREVEHWLQTKGVDTILVALTAGRLVWNDEARCFVSDDQFPLPSVLAGRFQTEPKWIDLTAYRDGDARASKRNPDFLTRAADLAAPIHGIAKEDLLSDELTQQRRALRLAWGAAGSLAVLAGLSAWQTIIARQERERVELVLAEGTRTANNLVLDLSQRFRGQKGIPQQFIIDVLGEARGLVSQLARSGGERPELLEAQATALIEIASAMRSQGKFDLALHDARLAVAVFAKLAARPDAKSDWGVGLAAAKDRVGDVLLGLNRYDEALGQFQESSALSKAQSDLGNSVARQNLAVSLEKIGQVYLATRRVADAKRSFQESIALREVMLAAEPKRIDLARALAIGHANIADAYLVAGERAAAVEQQRLRVALAERVSEHSQNNLGLQHDLALAYHGLAKALEGVGEAAEITALLEKNLAIVTGIADSDPDRIDWQTDVVAANDRIGAWHLVQAPETALGYFRTSLAVAVRNSVAEPSRADLSHARALAHRRCGDALRAMGRLKEALISYQSSLEVRTTAPASHMSMHGWNETLEVDFQILSDALVEAGRPREALDMAVERFERFANRGGAGRTADLDQKTRALEGISWFALFAGEHDRAIEAAREARALKPDEPVISLNEAHALMLSGRAQEARQLYAKIRQQLPSGRNVAELMRIDFAALRKAGISHPIMEEMIAGVGP